MSTGALFLVAAIIAAGYFLVAGSVGSHPYRDDGRTAPQETHRKKAETAEETRFGKKDLQHLIGNRRWSRLEAPRFEIHHDNRRLTVHTTVDPDLQNYLTSILDLRHSRYIAIVAMDPQTGRIKALVGFNSEDSTSNPCLRSTYPAASIFKIITAAAAVEKAGLNSNSTLTFNGRKHTLYKSQIREKINKYTNQTTLRDSFAQSINPVFGKLGALRLGRQILESYAEAFGFNRQIAFEIPLPPSHLEIDDEPYHWAEIASGFNQKTTISPVHGALIASAVINNGRLYEPSIVEHILDGSGQECYRNQPQMIDRAIDPATTRVMRELMETTVRSGTARKQFRRIKRDKVLSGLVFGGKTGSINTRDNTARYDWFVGYAAQKEGAHQLAIGVMVAHQDYIGRRATTYARMAFKRYFANLQQPETPAAAATKKQMIGEKQPVIGKF
jgi:cell division protein FtsI/penicillin-binding protein 2